MVQYTVVDNQSLPILLWPNCSWKLYNFCGIIFSFEKEINCTFLVFLANPIQTWLELKKSWSTSLRRVGEPPNVSGSDEKTLTSRLEAIHIGPIMYVILQFSSPNSSNSFKPGHRFFLSAEPRTERQVWFLPFEHWTGPQSSSQKFGTDSTEWRQWPLLAAKLLDEVIRILGMHAQRSALMPGAHTEANPKTESVWSNHEEWKLI